MCNLIEFQRQNTILLSYFHQCKKVKTRHLEWGRAFNKQRFHGLCGNKNNLAFNEGEGRLETGRYKTFYWVSAVWMHRRPFTPMCSQCLMLNHQGTIRVARTFFTSSSLPQATMRADFYFKIKLKNKKFRATSRRTPWKVLDKFTPKRFRFISLKLEWDF